MRWHLKIPPHEKVIVGELVDIEKDVYRFKIEDRLIELRNPISYPYALETEKLALVYEVLEKYRWKVAIKGKTYLVEPLAIGSSAATSEFIIQSPMPGKILKILAKPNNRVKPKDTLIVIEAMKMENEIRSEGSGEIESVSVREGQSVESGTELLRFKPLT